MYSGLKKEWFIRNKIFNLKIFENLRIMNVFSRSNLKDKFYLIYLDLKNLISDLLRKKL